jgi:zinc-ribbon domain
MAHFCENCGTSLSEGAKFCSSCGTQTGDTSRAAEPHGSTRAARATVAAKPGMSSAMKILLTLFGIFVFVVMLGVGGVFYAGYRVHKKAQELSKTATDPNALLNEIAKTLPGSGASALPNAGSQPTQPTGAAQQDEAPIKLEARHITKEDGQCALFTKEELAQVLGDTFTHADADATGCTYKGDAPRQWVRTEISWTGGRKEVGQIRESYQSLSRTMPKQNIPQQPFPGVGDEAFVNLWNSVHARKGNVGVAIDLRYYHDSESLTKQIVNAALDRVSGT